ncbi:hypothetical protein O1611_g4360 [Lasiodiplodia mahajangana]|uniref:Uncharacterized protein n=1 Tax=Lasiodiplodia mahajangana TaxID=1108764 RepID=A0ACC2JP41_9PEZI|nr:hypothetical protein O1611_g4360 [Lasiodiplodia mahajangana]
MESGIRILSRRYMATDHPIEFFETGIRDIWYMFTLAAQNIEAHHPAQDRLLRIILCARDRRVLQRTAEQETTVIVEEDATMPMRGEGPAAETSQGRIWTDPPSWFTTCGVHGRY